MTSVGVVHLDLMSKGGGEAVAMNAVEALQAEYDLTLLTATEPDVPALNDYFKTDVDGASLTVRLAGTLAPALHDRYGVGYYVLQNALLARYARRHADEFDLLVSTVNELGLPEGRSSTSTSRSTGRCPSTTGATSSTRASTGTPRTTSSVGGSPG